MQKENEIAAQKDKKIPRGTPFLERVLEALGKYPCCPPNLSVGLRAVFKMCKLRTREFVMNPDRRMRMRIRQPDN